MAHNPRIVKKVFQVPSEVDLPVSVQRLIDKAMSGECINFLDVMAALSEVSAAKSPGAACDRMQCLIGCARNSDV